MVDITTARVEINFQICAYASSRGSAEEVGCSVKMKRQSWLCTLVTQLSLCFALFLALNMGQPRKPIYHNRSGSRPIDIYFISVTGGFRPLKEQTHLLKQMEKVVKAYKARFVVNISELGEDDQLMLNATWYFQSLKVPWYTTRALKGQGADYFLKQIKIPYEKTLDVIAMDTGSLQDPSNGNGNDQLHWLTRTLEASNSSWQIVVGFNSLVACDENTDQMEAKQVFEPLYDILLKYGANAYLSGQSCANYIRKGVTAHIRNTGQTDKGPFFTSINQGLVFNKKIFNGFLLHRVSPLEFVTYFVTLTGEVMHKIELQQMGKEVM
uniref:Tartrate-resistant acid phosphatase type 5 n=2 Tax=Davidia involucrata TaxID=16924 RepID=A0A5B7BKU4_DAVIN